ncbi:pyruvate kinase [Brevibacterium ihuae]|uniref:pyruvate kinase n=1 Tax=Brevibacterium ihuae TaxID=1631743 RepID=UPI000C7607D6|nr:pyruvate kinase [Brevibacterium ihuae]
MSDPVRSIETLIADVDRLRSLALEAESRHAELIARVRDRHRDSARNLVHYVALRSEEIRDLQYRLGEVGVSTLGRMESGVLGHLDVVLTALRAQLGEEATEPAGLTPRAGRAILERDTDRLLGPAPVDRDTRIMVTMPSAAAGDPDLVSAMTAAGMDLARINCAHDDEAAWESMIAAIRARPAAGRTAPPLVATDLAGPKLRTGPLQAGPPVVKIKPERDASGRVTARSLVWLGTADAEAARGIEGALDAEELPLAGESAAVRAVLAELDEGDGLRITDARDSNRTLRVEARGAAGVLVSADRTIYWITGTAVRSGDSSLVIGELPGVEQSMRVHLGEDIVLTRSMEPRPAVAEPPYVIGCSLPEVFDAAGVGDAVWIDDGRIGGVVTVCGPDELTLRVTSAGPRGAKLKSEKGINLPDTDIPVPALTAADRSHIRFVAAHADMVNMSFVRSADDVAQLIDALAEQQAENVDITLKIETVAAFEQLPRMLLEAMRWQDVGVMIARGDLAVEAGFERMAELQEEILWLCEAAHVPVIWATQVLESLAKSGLPSRAEITDAAMAQRAECVMLNKGPYIEEAIAALSDILARMSGHTSKKRDMLRRLRSWSL